MEDSESIARMHTSIHSEVGGIGRPPCTEANLQTPGFLQQCRRPTAKALPHWNDNVETQTIACPYCISASAEEHMQHASSRAVPPKACPLPLHDSKRAKAPSGPIGHQSKHLPTLKFSWTNLHLQPGPACRGAPSRPMQEIGKVAVHNGLTLYFPACSPMPFRGQSRISQAAAAQNGQNFHKAGRKPLEVT